MDDDNPPSVAFASGADGGAAGTATVAEGTGETPTTGSLPVHLSAPSALPVTVAYAVTGGTATPTTDYTLAAGTLTFAPGEQDKSIDVSVVGDAVDEPDETVVVSLSAPTNATLGTPATGTLTITDDDVPPTATIANVRVNEGQSGTTQMTFTVVLSAPAPAGQPVSVTYATSNGNGTAGQDYVASSGVATIAGGQTSTTITVSVIGDTVVEPNESLRLNLSSPTGAVLGTTTATGVILNDD